MNLSSPPTTSGLNLSSSAPRASGLMNEPPLSPGPAPVSAPAPAPAAPATTPPPSLEAQVVRLGLMSTAEVATIMQEQAETGRPFAELAVEHGRISAEDLARLTGEAAPAVAPAPVAPVAPLAPERQLTPVPPPAEPEPALAPPALLRQPERPVEPKPEPPLQAAAEPEPVMKITLEPQMAAAPVPEMPAPPAAPKPGAATKASVCVRLTSGERISAGRFDTHEAAERRARELMIAIDAGGDWPRVEGRFIKPDAVVSIDVDAS